MGKSITRAKLTIHNIFSYRTTLWPENNPRFFADIQTRLTIGGGVFRPKKIFFDLTTEKTSRYRLEHHCVLFHSCFDKYRSLGLVRRVTTF